jgi:glycosyltransferase involved in cell wall biosynthesis
VSVRRRILLFNEYFPPDTSSTAQTAAVIAEALAQVHDVTVLAGRPSYDPAERHGYYLWRRQSRPGLVVERVGSTAYDRRRMRQRVANYLSYLALAVPRAVTMRADVVLSMTDPPVAGIAAAVASALRRRRFVYNLRDLYPDVAVATGLLRAPAIIRAWEWAHAWALRRADRVIVLGDDMRERVIGKGVDPARVVVVPNFAEIPPPVPADDALGRELRGQFPFVVMHAGNLGHYGAWDTLLHAASLLARDGVGFLFVGGGVMKARLEAEAARLPNVRFIPYRPAAARHRVLAAADVHVITIRRGMEGVVVPSKLYPVLAAGRPVLAVATKATDVARLAVAGGCGAAVDPEDAVGLAETVRRLRQDPDGLRRMGQRARALAEEFTPERQLRAFVDVITEVAETPSRGRSSR